MKNILINNKTQIKKAAVGISIGAAIYFSVVGVIHTFSSNSNVVQLENYNDELQDYTLELTEFTPETGCTVLSFLSMDESEARLFIEVSGKADCSWGYKELRDNVVMQRSKFKASH